MRRGESVPSIETLAADYSPNSRRHIAARSYPIESGSRTRQLPCDMREALAANARTKVVFACSPEDAAHLERHFDTAADGSRSPQPRLVPGGVSAVRRRGPWNPIHLCD